MIKKEQNHVRSSYLVIVDTIENLRVLNNNCFICWIVWTVNICGLKSISHFNKTFTVTYSDIVNTNYGFPIHKYTRFSLSLLPSLKLTFSVNLVSVWFSMVLYLCDASCIVCIVTTIVKKCLKRWKLDDARWCLSALHLMFGEKTHMKNTVFNKCNKEIPW